MIDDTDFFLEVARLGGSEYVVKVNGPIDGHNAGRLQQALVDALIAIPTRLTVNLAAVDSIDASGLDVLVGAYRRATAAGTRLLLQRADADLARVLEQNGLPTTAAPTRPDVRHHRGASPPALSGTVTRNERRRLGPP